MTDVKPDELCFFITFWNSTALGKKLVTFMMFQIQIRSCPGPALTSAGPDWKPFCGTPFSGMCRNVWGGSSSNNDRNHEWWENSEARRGNANTGVSRYATQFHLSNRDFLWPFHGHLRNNCSGHWFLPAAWFLRLQRKSFNRTSCAIRPLYEPRHALERISLRSSGKCVRCWWVGRSTLAGSYRDLVNWYCSLTRRTVCKRTAANTPRTQKPT